MSERKQSAWDLDPMRFDMKITGETPAAAWLRLQRAGADRCRTARGPDHPAPQGPRL